MRLQNSHNLDLSELTLTSSLVLSIVGHFDPFPAALTLLDHFNWVEKAVSDHLVSVLSAHNQLLGNAESLIHALLVVADVASFSRKFIIVVKLTL